METTRRHGLFARVALLAFFVIVGSAVAAPYEIPFQSGTFLPEDGRLSLPAKGERAHVLLQLETHLQKGQREALARAGVELLQYLPDRAYVAAIRRPADSETLRDLGVRYVGDLTVEQKLHPRVTGKRFGPWSEYSQNRRILAISVMPDVPLDQARLLLEQFGCEVGHRFEAAHALLVAIEPERVKDIAALDEVLFVNEAPPPLETLNNDVRSRLHVNELRQAPYNLTGDSVIILVYDGGMVDSTHPDFGGRVRWMEAGAVAAHPTHVAGTVGGSGQASSGTYQGMAPGARIISGEYDACTPYCLYESANDIEPDYTQARTVHRVELTTNSIGANIDPNSYPAEWFGDYESTSQVIDRLVRNTAGAPLIQFWAAGNERNGTTHGFTTYRCMSVPAGAKNIITCGATTNADAVASFSSWGPTDDGRIKPEVCATGVDVTSCVPGGGYSSMDGTSMATPATSGTACLILQQWHRMFPGAPDPLPETMKAIFINSATDLGSTGPDFQTGFGLVNALKSVQNLLAGGVLEGALEVGETFTHTFTVPTGLTALDVSLAWSDLPAIGNVIPTLINDLDLELENPSGGLHYPWKLRPASPNLPAITGVDSINVCERVHVNNPAAGTWTLRVRGRLNGSETQTFGLCANVPLQTAWATVTGQIRSAATLQGLAGEISVVGGAQRMLTDTSGSFLLMLPANASYTIRARSFGFAARDTLVAIATGTTNIELLLTTVPNGTVNGVVRSQVGNPIAGAEVRIFFPRASISPLTSAADGSFSASLPGDNTYDLLATWSNYSGEARVSVIPAASVPVNIVIYNPRFQPTGPDGYGYYAYEVGDLGSTAVYNWIEISPSAGGSGTLIPSPGGNDWVVSVNTPFPIRYYGQTSNQVQVSADGWVRVGGPQTADSTYANRGIPSTRVPNGIICLFWDDLYPYAPEGGDVSHYYDPPGGRFIIEYRLVPHYSPRTNLTTAQLIFYDTAVRPTLSGNNEFLMQFQRLDYDDGTQDADATIGIEDFEGDDGIQIVFDGVYNQTCNELAPGSAILFTPTAIQGLGAVRGQLTLVPPPADWSQVNVTVGAISDHPNANGAFLVDSLAPGTYPLDVTLTGYETGHVDAVVITIGDTVQADFTLYRLDPPRNLTGEWDPVAQQILLRWDWPLWHAGQLTDAPRGGEHLDIFRSFRVWSAHAGLLGSTSDTFFVYRVQQSRAYRFWIEAQYDGGTADTSNNFRITIDLSAGPLVSAIPTEFYLKQNYPNPFNPVTFIEYGLPRSASVTVGVFDVLGREVAVLQDGPQAAGVYRIAFDAGTLGSGVYYIRLSAGDFRHVQKALLLR